MKKLFLDDLRTVDMIYAKSEIDSFDVVTNYDDFVSYIKSNGLPNFISFDNDLGLDANGEVAPDGYAAAKWLVYESGLDLSQLKFKVHSANPVASEQIKGLLTNYINHLKEEAIPFAMTTNLTIEKILPIKGHGQYVLVRPTISGQKFSISGKTFLDNVELDNYLDIPRKTKENGDLDLDLYSVRLKNDHEAYRLKEKAVVELIPGNLPCLPPWHFVDEGLNSQLEREINRGHILYGKDVKTIARRQDNDDVLFAVFDSDFKYAKVHLTWSQSKSSDSTYPTTSTYKDWTDIYENVIIPANKDWD
jgi:hypothetical protein